MNVINDELLAALEDVRGKEVRKAMRKAIQKGAARGRLNYRIKGWPDAMRSSRWRGPYTGSIPDARARFKQEGKEIRDAISVARRVINQGMADKTLTVADVGVQLELLKQATRSGADLTMSAARKILDKAHPALAAYQAQLDKLADGVWKKVPWDGSQITASTLVHLSEADPTRVAYTQSVEKLVRNLQTVTSPGKFLKRYCPDMADAEIKRWAEITMANAAPWEMNLLNNNDPQWEGQSVALRDEWARLYARVGVNYSCMKGKSYVRAYGRPGNHLGLAYFSKGGDLQGRCIVRLDNMEYLRAFPSSEVSASLIEGMLEAAGYARCKEGLEGIRLSRIQGYVRDVVMPYIDGDCQEFDIYDGHILICLDGEYTADSQTGSYSVGEDGGEDGGEDEDDMVECDDCDDRVGVNDLTYVEPHDHHVCDDCLGNYYHYAIIGRSHGVYQKAYVRKEECTYVEGSIGMYVLDGVLRELGFKECEDTGDYYPIDEMVLTLEGYCCMGSAIKLGFKDEEGNEYAIESDTTTTVFGNVILTEDSVKTVGGSIAHSKELETYPLAELYTSIRGRDFITLDELKENMGGAESLCLTLDEHDEIEDLFVKINDEMLEELKLWMGTETAIERGSIKHPAELPPLKKPK